MKFKLYTLSLLAAMYTCQAIAQKHAHEFGLQSDNDSYLAQGSDRYYTNGIFMYYHQALNLSANSRLANKIWGIEAGQKMYNPQSGSVPARMYVDRPFAGYLYAGTNLNLLYKNESSLKLSVQTGIIGPAALGEEAQNVIHNTFGFYELEGWQYQIRNNFQLNLEAEYNRLLARASWIDVTASLYGKLGTGFNGAGIGPLIRLGKFNQLFNSVSTQSTASTAGTPVPTHNHELFAYYKPQFNYVGYDATVQGSLFTSADPTSLEVTRAPNHTMVSHRIGLAYGDSRWVIDAAAVVHTRDVKGQVFKTHQWGSVMLLYRFK